MVRGNTYRLAYGLDLSTEGLPRSFSGVISNSRTLIPVHRTAEVKEWLAKNPRVHFHYTPTSASWLNQVEGFFGIIRKQSLGVAHFPSKAALREHIDAYIAHWNDDPTPFISTKPAASIIRSRKRMLDRISHSS
jgi:transposase